MTRSLLKTALVLLLAVSAITSIAQTFRGTLSGTVTDPSGAVLGDATVILSNPSTGYNQAVQSGKGGGFPFPELPGSIYSLAATPSGFHAPKIDKLPTASPPVTPHP